MDGQALLYHATMIIKSNYDRVTQQDAERPVSLADHVKSLLIQLHKCGFECIKVLFFTDQSEDLVNRGDLVADSAVFDDVEIRSFVQTVVFSTWSNECTEWLDFTKREHICLVLTTTRDIYMKNHLQFDLIYNLLQTHKLQVALFESMLLHATYVSGFLVQDPEETLSNTISTANDQGQASTPIHFNQYLILLIETVNLCIRSVFRLWKKKKVFGAKI